MNDCPCKRELEEEQQAANLTIQELEERIEELERDRAAEVPPGWEGSA